MALFDNLSKKASEAGQTAIQKAKELSETTRLNSMISDEEKVINNTYYQIGKLYAAIHRDNPEPDFSSMISLVTEAEAKIRNYKQQIQEIKGVQRCENCGAEVPRGAAFCSSCGAAMPKIEAAAPGNYVTCGNCGAKVEKGMRFCTACGTPMETTSPAEPVPVAESEVAEIEVTDRVCPNCGAKVEKGIRFCTACGTPMETTPPAEPTSDAESEVVEAIAGDRVCPNCGAKLDDDSVFCTECGTKL